MATIHIIYEDPFCMSINLETKRYEIVLPFYRGLYKTNLNFVRTKTFASYAECAMMVEKLRVENRR